MGVRINSSSESRTWSKHFWKFYNKIKWMQFAALSSKVHKYFMYLHLKIKYDLLTKFLRHFKIYINIFHSPHITFIYYLENYQNGFIFSRSSFQTNESPKLRKWYPLHFKIIGILQLHGDVIHIHNPIKTIFFSTKMLFLRTTS